MPGGTAAPTPKKIAIICFHSCPIGRLGEKNTGGMNVYVSQLARELAAQGSQVDIFTRTHDPDEPPITQLADGARVIHIDAGPVHAQKDELPRYTRQFVDGAIAFQQSGRIKYDIIHSHYWQSGVAAIRLSRQWRAPHISTFHTLARTKQRARAGEQESPQRAHAEQRIIQSAKTIVVSTHIEKHDITRLYDANGARIQVIPPGVDTDLFAPTDAADARRRLNLPHKPTILYVGRIEPLKGIDILLRAVPLLRKTPDAPNPDINLLIVGGNLAEDAEIARLQALAADLNIDDITTFTGAVSQTQLPAYYNAADIFVLPSWYESFGLAALEAMTCGTPVVVSRVGGLTTFVEHGKTGHLVPWRCPEAFARSLETLLENPALRQAMGRAARRKALGMSWAAMANRMLNCYYRACK